MVKHHIAQKADVTIACLPVDARDATSFGIMKVNSEGYIPRFIEKPNADLLPDWVSEVSPPIKSVETTTSPRWASTFSTEKPLATCLINTRMPTDFGKEIIPAAIEEGRKVAAYQYEGYWTDIGTIRSFFEANIELTDHIPAFNLFDNRHVIYTRGRMLPPAKFYGGTQLNRALIAEGSIIHARMIEGSIIGLRSRIGENTVIKDCHCHGQRHLPIPTGNCRQQR